MYDCCASASEQQAATATAAGNSTRMSATMGHARVRPRPTTRAAFIAALTLGALVLLNLNGYALASAASTATTLQKNEPKRNTNANSLNHTPNHKTSISGGGDPEFSAPAPAPNSASAATAPGEKVKKGGGGFYSNRRPTALEDPFHNEILKQIQAKQHSSSSNNKLGKGAPAGRVGHVNQYGKIAKSPHVAPWGDDGPRDEEEEEDDFERLLKATASHRPSVPVWGFLPHRNVGATAAHLAGGDERSRQLLKNELVYFQQHGGGAPAHGLAGVMGGVGDQPIGSFDDEEGYMMDGPLKTHINPHQQHQSSSPQSQQSQLWSHYDRPRPVTGAADASGVAAKRSPQSSHLSLGISTEYQPHHSSFVGGGGYGGGGGGSGDGRRTTEDLKRSRPYDVPQIECPLADDNMERFACPSPDSVGRYRCVDDHVLCDGFLDCPNGEDEDRQACMFYKTTKAHLDVLADALLRWARGKKK